MLLGHYERSEGSGGCKEDTQRGAYVKGVHFEDAICVTVVFQTGGSGYGQSNLDDIYA